MNQEIQYTPFNINDYVKVKLTDYGKECLKKNYDELAAHYNGKLPFEFSLPAEDENGFTKWQMHDLISSLGKYVVICGKLPFETTILIETKL